MVVNFTTICSYFENHLGAGQSGNPCDSHLVPAHRMAHIVSEHTPRLKQDCSLQRLTVASNRSGNETANRDSEPRQYFYYDPHPPPLLTYPFDVCLLAGPTTNTNQCAWRSASSPIPIRAAFSENKTERQQIEFTASSPGARSARGHSRHVSERWRCSTMITLSIRASAAHARTDSELMALIIHAASAFVSSSTRADTRTHRYRK
ncbi:unnamed protein product [Nesidiocoris tenuis]|uniref:Uncharacterized protein n=1 Tax=Nesidiocoris tenuis TaxID=355587 RepID=A0A6H5G349_9HEMI|nr:unnamed protein product [Nesidiocoris tenuis]CAA9996065.1 unnamed protein product [Nesidiocoris tenuis]